MELNAAVMAGVELLDRVRPEWATELDEDGDYRVNLRTLNIAGMWECLLAQLYGDYGCGLDALEDVTRESVVGSDYGFIGYEDSRHVGILSNAELTEQWRMVIRQRRG